MDYYYVSGSEVYKMDTNAQEIEIFDNVEHVVHKYVGNDKFPAFKSTHQAWQFLIDKNLDEHSKLIKEFKRLKDNQFLGNFKP